jgi:DNA-directed RNA polymerase subunit K/omega
MPPKRKEVKKAPEPEPEPEFYSADEQEEEEVILDEDGDMADEIEAEPNEVQAEEDDDMEMLGGEDEMDERIIDQDEDTEPLEEENMACSSADMIDMREDDYIIEQSDHLVYTDISTDDIEKYHTNPYMTKYEMARVLGVRSAQLERGAAALVQPEDFDNGRYPLNNVDIARKELQLGRSPFIIARPLPNGIRLLIKANRLKNLNYH